MNDIDFELELIRRDEINVTYILTLLAKLHDSEPKEQEEQRKAISDILASESQLRSKKELIEKFIAENLPLITDSELVSNEFESFWTVEKKKAILRLAKEENLDFQKLVDLVGNYLFTEKEPLRDEIIAVMKERPSLRERASSSDRILGKVKDFVETFIDGMG